MVSRCKENIDFIPKSTTKTNYRNLYLNNTNSKIWNGRYKNTKALNEQKSKKIKQINETKIT